jgi:hypothetical protein
MAVPALAFLVVISLLSSLQESVVAFAIAGALWLSSRSDLPFFSVETSATR